MLIKCRNVIMCFGVRVTVLQGCRCVRGNSGMATKSREISWECSALQGTGPKNCVRMGYYMAPFGNQIPGFRASLVPTSWRVDRLYKNPSKTKPLATPLRTPQNSHNVVTFTRVPHDNLQWMWHILHSYRTITYNGYVAHFTFVPHDNLQWICGTLYIGTAR